MADSIRHLASTVQSAKEMGIIEKTQVINIIDSVVQRTSFDIGQKGGSFDACLFKLDTNGNLQWNKTFGGTQDDGATFVLQTIDGGYILSGFTYSNVPGGDAWLIKTDANGNELWNKTFGGTGIEYAYSVLQTSDGGYALGAGSNVA